MILFVKRVKERGSDGIGVLMDTFHEVIWVKIFDKRLDILKKVVFSIRGLVVNRDHKAHMTDVTLSLERARRIRGLVFSHAAEFLMGEFIFIFAFGAAQEHRGCIFKAV